jgi:hypothetical protein
MEMKMNRTIRNKAMPMVHQLRRIIAAFEAGDASAAVLEYTLEQARTAYLKFERGCQKLQVEIDRAETLI